MTRYKGAVQRFLFWVLTCYGVLAVDLQQLDTQAADYIECLWAEGETKLLAGDTLSGIQHFLNTRKILTGAWPLYNVWTKVEAPCQVPPLLPLMVQALVGAAWAAGDVAFSACVAVGYHCCLRTGEFLNIGEHSLMLGDNDCGLLGLGYSKTGKRKGVQEMVVIEEPTVGWLCKHACKLSPNPTKMFAEGANIFHAKFAQYLVFLGLSEIGFKPCSIRRGKPLMISCCTRTLSAL